MKIPCRPVERERGKKKTTYANHFWTETLLRSFSVPFAARIWKQMEKSWSETLKLIQDDPPRSAAVALTSLLLSQRTSHHNDTVAALHTEVSAPSQILCSCLQEASENLGAAETSHTCTGCQPAGRCRRSSESFIIPQSCFIKWQHIQRQRLKKT